MWTKMSGGTALLHLAPDDKRSFLNTNRAHVLGYQALASVGLGPLLTSLPFPILAPLPVSLNANALAFYSFVRYIAMVSEGLCMS